LDISPSPLGDLIKVHADARSDGTDPQSLEQSRRNQNKTKKSFALSPGTKVAARYPVFNRASLPNFQLGADARRRPSAFVVLFMMIAAYSRGAMTEMHFIKDGLGAIGMVTVPSYLISFPGYYRDVAG
jgi:hypothetical protein